MKRFLLSSLLVALSTLVLYSGLPRTTRVHAQPEEQNEKASAELKVKEATGAGDQLVQVIVQPKVPWDNTLDTTVQTFGGNNVKQFQNFGVSAVTLSVDAAVALAARDDIAYVSLNRS